MSWNTTITEEVHANQNNGYLLEKKQQFEGKLRLRPGMLRGIMKNRRKRMKRTWRRRILTWRR